MSDKSKGLVNIPHAVISNPLLNPTEKIVYALDLYFEDLSLFDKYVAISQYVGLSGGIVQDILDKRPLRLKEVNNG